MNTAIKNLEPKALWSHFADLNSVPRPSKKEERIIQFMVDFGNSLGLETQVDEIGNVVIRKPATEGMEIRKTIVLQGHLDMVHQKNNDTQFDFNSQGIEMYVDGDWVKAKGTTLGADNGLGVAAIMAVLSSTDLPHPAIEALFTIDEETGMTGAKELKGNLLTGEILLNLDTEEDDEIGIGCAGGIDISATKSYDEVLVDPNGIGYTISVKGLQGGHSGMDIIKELGNANKMMNRILFEVSKTCKIQIASLEGGSLRNAIPRESIASVALPKTEENEFLKEIQKRIDEIKTEFKSLEPNLDINVKPSELPEKVMTVRDQDLFLKAIYATHNGVYRMSPDVPGLVETSNNIAKVIVNQGAIQIECLTRSSSESNKRDLSNTIASTLEMAGFKVGFSGEYPGWLPNLESPILKSLVDTYKRLFHSDPNVAACHAGLECGILGQHYPNMDMISFGPNIKGAHSPDERAQISSSQKFWKLLAEVLKNIPLKE